jgi:hypothetical protein
MPEFAEFLRGASLTVFTASALLRDLVKSTWFRSVDLSVTIPAGETEITVPHGLGRAFNGAAVVGQSSTARAPAISLPGTDAQTHLTVSLLAPALGSDLTVKLRVY